MYIGEILRERMTALDINIELLSEKSFVDQEVIEDILYDTIDSDDIDTFDLELISKCLYCDINYFIDKSVRGKDMIHSSMNRGNNDVKSNNVKGQLQVVVNDFVFLRQIMSEIQK